MAKEFKKEQRMIEDPLTKEDIVNNINIVINELKDISDSVGEIICERRWRVVNECILLLEQVKEGKRIYDEERI